MKNAIKTILVLLAVFAVIITLFIINRLTKYVPQNPPDTIGNSAGNLNNGGYFCEDSDGTVYFANFYDDGTLYAMNADESNIRKISDTKVTSLNTAGNYLYYYMPDSTASTGLGFVRRVVGIYRSTKKGTSAQTLSRDPAGRLLLCGNTIYYQTAADATTWNLSAMDTTGKNKTVMHDQSINPASCHNGIIYYANMQDNHFLYMLDTATGTSTQLLKYNVWDPVYADGLIYFMDMEHNYRLCSYDLSDGEVTVITSDRIDFYNVTSDYIYYQKSSPTSPALKRIRLDGSHEELIAEGNYCNINITSRYVYFQEFGSPLTIYHMPANGPVSVSEFAAAAEAVK